MIDIEFTKQIVKDLRQADKLALSSAQEYLAAINNESKSDYERIALAMHFLETLVGDFILRADIMLDLHKLLNGGEYPDE